MPIYEYNCEDCGTRFDALRTMSDADAPIDCEQCAGDKTSRAISLFNAQSSGRVLAGSNGGCSGCSGGGSCSGCGS